MRLQRTALAAALTLGLPGAAWADPIGDFYKGRTISWILSAGAGGGYASYAQAFAPYFSAHIPGHPTVVIQNMPGGGGIRAMLHLALSFSAWRALVRESGLKQKAAVEAMVQAIGCHKDND